MAPKSYLSPSDRARIERELKELQARRKASDHLKDGGHQFFRPPEVDMSDGNLAAREEKLRGVLSRETPPVLDPSAKNKAYAEFKELVREFESNALTKYDQGLGYPKIMEKMGPDAELAFERSKKKCLGWEMGERGQHVTHRMKELAGVLDPSNPDLRNLENFRRRK